MRLGITVGMKIMMNNDFVCCLLWYILLGYTSISSSLNSLNISLTLSMSDFLSYHFLSLRISHNKY